MGILSIRGMYVSFDLLLNTTIIYSNEETYLNHFQCLQLRPEIACVDIGLCSYNGSQYVRL